MDTVIELLPYILPVVTGLVGAHIPERYAKAFWSVLFALVKAKREGPQKG